MVKLCLSILTGIRVWVQWFWKSYWIDMQIYILETRVQNN